MKIDPLHQTAFVMTELVRKPQEAILFLIGLSRNDKGGLAYRFKEFVDFRFQIPG
jgi:hypothetical protein